MSLEQPATHTVAIVLAGGKGTRLKSNTPKVLQPLLGKSLIYRVLKTLSQLETPLQTVYIVVGHQLEAVTQHVESFPWPFSVRFVEQTPQLGTGHAVQQVLSVLPPNTPAQVLITCGDMPLVKAETYDAAITLHESNQSSTPLLLVTTKMRNPSGYGRVLRDDTGHVIAIVEERDATEKQKAITWVNSGIYVGNWPQVAATLPLLSNTNQQQEYYLTDVVSLLNAQNLKTHTLETTDETEMLGINSRSDLAQASDALSKRHIQDLMTQGVSFINADSSVVAPEVRIDAESTVYPGSTLLGDVSIASHCMIGPHATLLGLEAPIRIEQNVEILHSVLERGVTIGENSTIGPYAHLRDEAVVSDHCKIGNFVEVKQATIGSLSNAAHLSYIGDAVLGKNVNMGAGSIIANYDPIRDEKHTTHIADNVKVGSNSTLISPVILSDNACIAAGSTITDDVEANALAIARQRQSAIPDWVNKTQAKVTTQVHP
jgi:bifunctional UDP-N-acetylglucosamine pyrophosphorylase / glucosamine-1-phosphate N-acetyltransferase